MSCEEAAWTQIHVENTGTEGLLIGSKQLLS